MKKFFCVFLCLVSVIFLTSCSFGSNKELGSINYELDETPRSLDPLLASSFSELQITKNIFEGLLRLNKDQNIVPGCAESYSVSEDGTVYTFKLYPELFWSDKEKLTAKDFVFGISRALLPETSSPYASTLFDILNAEALNSGEVSSDTLGIKATDENTLVITLKSPSKNFLQTLTTPAAMPCREDFFNSCEGRYGLGKKYIISNGAYYLRTWIDEYTDKEIVLSKNNQYKGNFTATLQKINFSFDGTDKRLDRLGKKITSLAVLEGSMIEDAKLAGLNILSYQKSCYALCINPDDNIFSNTQLRQALAKTVDRSSYTNSLKSYFSTANCLVPAGTSVGQSFYRTDNTDNFALPFDESGAKELFDQYIAENKGVMPTVKILYSVPELKTVISYIAQSWQRNFGIYAVPAEVSESEIKTAMSSGNYQIAVCSFASTDDSVFSLLNKFRSNSGSSFSAFGTPEYDDIISTASAEQNDETAMAYYKQAEQLLLQNAAVIPLAFELDGFAYTSDILEISLFPKSTVIDFTATKAKYIK